MNALLRFFSHPAIGILGSVASIIGLGLALYFYYASIRAPELTYHFHPVRTTVVKAGGASALKVLFTGNEIQNDITAVQIAFWNAGKEPVTSATILNSIQIHTQNSVPILEATIRKVSRPEANFSLDQSHITKGTVGLTWGILEQDDGAIIQLIYEGDVSNILTVTGSVVGQKRISELKYSGSISSPAEQYAKQVREKRLLGLGALATGVCAAFMGSVFIIIRRSRANDAPCQAIPRLFRKMEGTMLVIGIVYSIGGCIWLYFVTPPTPPFGF